MRLYFLLTTLFIVLIISGCSKNQKAIPLEHVEERIYHTFDEQNNENRVEDINEFSIEKLKHIYTEYADYAITESELSKVLVINDMDYTIIHFNPIVSGIELNNSYVVQLHDGYISSISTNPSKYKIPEKFDIDNIISIEKRSNIKERLNRKYEKIGKIEEITDQVYFDCNEYGKLLYSIKVSVDTSDYSFARLYIYDAYSGKLLNKN